VLFRSFIFSTVDFYWGCNPEVEIQKKTAWFQVHNTAKFVAQLVLTHFINVVVYQSL